MESRKNRYQFDRLPMVLFIACLAITVVAALEQSRVKSKVSTENHYSPVYVGDLNVTEGKPFRIVCHAKPPIAWFKDGERIQIHKVRHGRENFTYIVKDLMLLDDPKGKVESTLTVSKADLSHRGKYQCNINFESSFFLQVYPIPQVIDEEQKFTSSLESEYDHEEERIKFETTFDDDRAMPSTMLRFTTPTVTQSSGYYEPAPDYEFREKDNSDERVSRYETENEVIAEENFETNNLPQENFEIQTDQLDIIEEVLPTVSSSPAITSLTKIPFHPTHATTHSNQVVHTTHAIPSEVQIQYHPDKHRHKGKITPDYDEKEGNNKLFNLTRPIVLTCATDVAAEGDKIVWTKMVSPNGDDDDDDEKMVSTEVKNIKKLEDRYKIIPKEGRFIIERSIVEDAGNYSCTLGDQTFTFNVYSMVYVKVDDNAYVIEEEKLELQCKVRGTKPIVTWEHRAENSNTTNKVLEDNERIKLEEYNGVEDAMLVIEKAKLSDRGYYTCIGTNLWMDEPNKSESFVRVKDKLAALWPFLGICAEVFFLCAIILIYEKRRNKTDLEESDTDQSPDQKNDHKDSDVRQRK